MGVVVVVVVGEGESSSSAFRWRQKFARPTPREAAASPQAASHTNADAAQNSRSARPTHANLHLL